MLVNLLFPDSHLGSCSGSGRVGRLSEDWLRHGFERDLGIGSILIRPTDVFTDLTCSLRELICCLARIGIVVHMPRQVFTSAFELWRLRRLLVAGLTTPIHSLATTLALTAARIGGLVLQAGPFTLGPLLRWCGSQTRSWIHRHFFFLDNVVTTVLLETVSAVVTTDQ